MSSWIGDSVTPSACRWDYNRKRCRRRIKRLTPVGKGDTHSDSIRLPTPKSGIVVPSMSDSGLVWYSITFTVGGILQIDTYESPKDVDTELGVYKDDGTLLIYGDDVRGRSDYLSNVELPVIPGTYLIVVGRFNTIFRTNFEVRTELSSVPDGIRLNVDFTPNDE
jgi:hypothetical protein